MNFLRSTVGKKIIVGVTGLAMFGFVFGHLLGNLYVFEGPDKLNRYAAFLQDNKDILWGTRLVIIVSVVLHVWATIQLTRQNRASRPIPYQQHQTIQATKPSLFMIWSGAFLGVYILYHLTHLTLGWTHSTFSRHNVYANVITAFSHWPVSIFYILGMIFLGFHLYHGVFSVFQTVGLSLPKYDRFRRWVALTTAVLIPAGFISIPVGVLLGILRLGRW